jgi:signal transduction histidine kinase
MGTRRATILALRKNGEELHADAAIAKLEVGAERLFTVSLRDISEQKRVEGAERLLAKVGRVLVAAGMDYQRLLTEVAGVIVRELGGWCAVDVVEAGDIRRLRIVHSDPAMAATCEALERYPAVRKLPSPVVEVVETKSPVLVAELPSGWLEANAESAEHLRLMRALDPGSFIVVPLLARGHTLGTLGLGLSRRSRRYGPEDVRLVERLASRVALAMDNARLHEALERAVRARDEALAIVAHDLRNPLNTIVLQAQVLRRSAPPELGAARPYESLHRAAKRMDRLIQDLLDVTRLEAGERLSVTREVVDTASLVAEAIEQQEAALGGRHVDVATTGEPSFVWGDRARLLQVFDNLLGNATKFSRGRITVGATPRDGEVLFWVADDGEGIAKDALPHVFDRFWQVRKADRRGAGLGLSIVKGIVDAHGGRVWAESEVALGTTFYFTLPVPRRVPTPPG